jgi:predicted MPP superfamily phosphohydrolase
MKTKIFTLRLPFVIVIAGTIELGSYLILTVAHTIGFINPPTITELPIIIFYFLPILLATTMVIGMWHYSRLVTLLYSIGIVWIGIFIYFFSGAVILALLYLLATFTNISLPFIILAWTLIGFTIISIVYGIFNATRIRTTTYTIPSPTLAPHWKNKTIVLVSDTHLGIIRQGKFLEKVISTINAQNPDIVFIAGDIVDGPRFPYEAGFAPLKNLRSTLGVFYTPGNHEAYNQEPEIWMPLVQSATTMLEDEKTTVNNTQIIGLSYAIESEEKTRTRLMDTGFDKDIPSIVMLHDPKHAKTLQDAGVSLVLSGHTHRGQFFPLTVIVKLLYGKYSYGQTTRKENVSITTSGVGTAMTPMRFGTNPEIVVITIV